MAPKALIRNDDTMVFEIASSQQPVIDLLDIDVRGNHHPPLPASYILPPLIDASPKV